MGRSHHTIEAEAVRVLLPPLDLPSQSIIGSRNGINHASFLRIGSGSLILSDKSDLGNLASIVILQLVDVAYNLALLGVNSGQKKEFLQVFVVTEWRGHNDDLL